MTTSETFAPDTGALASLLDAGEGPVIVLDPCGELWKAFWQTRRWSRLWQAWRLAPGQTQEGDVWNVMGSLRHVNRVAGTQALSAALFPAEKNSDLTRQLMACLLTFADETRHVSDLPSLAGPLWADDPWAAIARWSRKYPYDPALQTARGLLTREGASDAVLAIRNRMGSYHHPHVAETFAGAPGLSLSAISQRPGQVIFLTPDIHCMENTELTAVYGFLVAALQSMAALHCIKFAVVEPVLTAEGMQYDNA